MAWSDDNKFLTDYQNEFGTDPKGTGDPAGMEELYKKYKSNFDSFKSIDAQFHDWYSDAHDGLSVTGLEGGEYEKARQAFLNEKGGANSQPAPSPVAQSKPVQQSNAQTLEKSAPPVQQSNENTEQPTQLNEVEVVAKKENNKNMANNQNSEPNVLDAGGDPKPSASSSSFDLDAILSDSSIRDSYVNRYDALSDGKISKDEAKDLGLRRLQRWRLNRAIDRGNNEHIKDYVNSGAKRTYVSNGKFITEGEKGWDDKAFENAKAAGFGGYNSGRRWKETLGNAYNSAVDDWRKNTEITFDPVTGKMMAKGFNNGDLVDVSNSEWAKIKNEQARKDWFEANKGNLSYDNGSVMFNGNAIKDSSWMDQDFVKKLSADDFMQDVANYKGDFKGFQNLAEINETLGFDKKAQKASDYAEQYRQKLDEKLQEFTRVNGAVAGSALYKYLQNNKLLHVGKGQDITLRAAHPYMQAQALQAGTKDNYAFMHRNGGNLNIQKVKAYYKKGGQIQYAGWGDVLDYVPLVGTYRQAKDMYNRSKNGENLGWQDWTSFGISAAGDALMFVPGVGTAAGNGLKTLAKGTGKMVTKITPKFIKNTGKALANTTKKVGTKAFRPHSASIQSYQNDILKKVADMKGSATWQGNKLVGFTKQGATDAEKVALKELQEAYAANAQRMTKQAAKQAAKQNKNLGKQFLYDPWKNTKLRLKWAGVGALSRGAYDIAHGRGFFAPSNETAETAETTEIAVPTVTTGADNAITTGYSNYTVPTPIETSNFQATGTDWYYKNGGTLKMRNLNYYQEGAAISAAPVQEEESALGRVLSDEQMASMFCQLMSQQMGQEVTPDTLIQLIQKNPEIAESLESFAQDFMNQVQGTQSAKRGAKLSYIKSLKSGCPEGYEVTYHKKGGRLCKECVKKAQIGAKLRKGFETAVNAVSPGEALYNPENQKAASRQLFGKVGDAFNPASMVRSAGNYVREAANGVRNAYSTVTDPSVSTMDKAKAVGSAVLPFLPGGHLPTTARKLGQRMAAHQKGGNLSPKELQEVKAATERNRKKFGKKYTEAQLRGAEPVGKDSQGRDLYLNGDGEAMPIACKGGKAKKAQSGTKITSKGGRYNPATGITEYSNGRFYDASTGRKGTINYKDPNSRYRYDGETNSAVASNGFPTYKQNDGSYANDSALPTENGVQNFLHNTLGWFNPTTKRPYLNDRRPGPGPEAGYVKSMKDAGRGVSWR